MNYNILTVGTALLLLFCSKNSSAQCEAAFIFGTQGLSYTFEDQSTASPGDTIISWIWDFGDGSTDTVQNVSHSYIFPGEYDVTLTIMTSNNCTASTTRSIKNCRLALEAILGDKCLGTSQEVLISISDLYSVVDSVDILIDNVLLPDSPFAIGNSLTKNILVPGDNELHIVKVTSPYSDECEEEFFVFAGDCSQACANSNLKAVVNETHIVEVRDTVFFPANRIITLGDTVIFDWISPANSSTSDTLEGPDSWDSGVLFVGSTFQIIPQEIGVKPYYSLTKGGPDGEGMSGTIIVNCPPLGLKTIDLSFENETVPPAGFRVAINDVILNDSLWQYSNTGITNLQVRIPADNQTYKVSVIDIADPLCTLSTIAKAEDCGGVFPCNLNLDLFKEERCDNGEVEVTAVISALGYSSDGVALLLDGAFTLDTLFLGGAGVATTTFTIPGDGQLHRLEARDLGFAGCKIEKNVRVADCTEPCILSALSIQTVTRDAPLLYLDEGGFSNSDIGIPDGKGMQVSWITDTPYGIRSTDTLPTFDSGVRSVGSLWITPALAAHRTYEVYDQEGLTVSTGTITPLKRCEQGMIPVFFNFQDDNGSAAGYSVLVNGETIASELSYTNGARNYFAFQIVGTDANQQLQIIDNDTGSCIIAGSFFAQICKEFVCELSLNMVESDSCFNDNTKLYYLQILNPTPFPLGFALTLDGDQLGPNTLQYTGDSLTNYRDTILADGSTYRFIATDQLNTTCSDTLDYTPEICTTPCMLSGMTLAVIDSSYKAANPNTPDVFVGCQQDSTAFVAIKFNEKYTDAASYSIFIDGVFRTAVMYEEGDGENIAFVPIFGDSLVHTVSIVDLVDGGCTVESEILVPKCFTECRIFKESISMDTCVNDNVQITIELNIAIEATELIVTDNGSQKPTSVVNDSLMFQIFGDGLQHEIVLQESANLLCTDTILMTAPYCLDCLIAYDLIQLDSCSNGDTIRYMIDIAASNDDQLLLTVNGNEQVIDKLGDNIFSIKANGLSSQVVLSSLTDQFCSEAFTIETEDCSPITCIADFTTEFDGLRAIFTDNSITTEPIISQSWSIQGGISVEDVPTFTFNFSEAGTYTVCHGIVTDSCSNLICKEIVLSPCSDFEAEFEYVIDGSSYQFTDLSTGDIETYSYDFGDGNVLSDPDPEYTFATSGSYNVCLTIVNETLDCEDTYCELIDFVSAINDPVSDVDLKVYPNPILSERKIVIESSIPIEGYAIFSTTGKLLQSADIFLGADKLSITLQDRTADGLVMLHLKTKKGTFVRKVVCGF